MQPAGSTSSRWLVSRQALMHDQSPRAGAPAARHVALALAAVTLTGVTVSMASAQATAPAAAKPAARPAATPAARPASTATSGASLLDALREGDRATAKSLLARRPADARKVAPDGTTALHLAVQRDDVELVDLLLKAGADAKAANRYGATPLYVACQNGSAPVIERLLKAGADAKAASPDGETMLMTAARTGKVEAVKLLLANGADPKATESWRGQTALMWAAAENHPDVVQTLIEAGADINARSNGGFSPLLFAVRAGRMDTVKLLLAKGANPRFVVTTLAAEQCDARTLYEQEYCARGNMENRIKEQQLCLFADRTSCHSMRATPRAIGSSSEARTTSRAATPRVRTAGRPG